MGIYTGWEYTQGAPTGNNVHTGWVAYTQGGYTHRALLQETMYTQGGFTHRVGMHTGDIHAGSSYRKQCTHRAGGRRKDAAAFT